LVDKKEKRDENQSNFAFMRVAVVADGMPCGEP
jgi:hypothetical protein